MPTELASPSLAASAGAGGEAHGCVVQRSTGGLSCWGDNGYGRLGTGDFTGRSSPASVLFTP